jgi:N-acetylglucosaminylphosphatidylinositol deacetylase
MSRPRRRRQPRPAETCEGEQHEHERHGRRRLRVFVIAHPDDESMFFVPTIHHFVQQQQQQQQKSVDLGCSSVWLVCLTSGNYNGLGTIRSKELHRTCKDILGIDKVILLKEEQENNGIFFDHPRQSWDMEKATHCLYETMQDALRQEVLQQQDAVQMIDFVTFDELGVSGHVNHRDTYRTVKCLCEMQKQRQQQPQQRHCQDGNDFPRCSGWTLETEQNIISKYLPIYSWILLLLSMFCSFTFKSEPQSSWQDVNDDDIDDDDAGSVPRRVVYRLHQPWLNWNAMRSHASQFVWYRRLFVIFSSYTYVNVLQRMNVIAHPQQPQQQQQQQQQQNDK